MQLAKNFLFALMGFLMSLQLSAQRTNFGSKVIYDNIQGDVEYSIDEYLDQVNERLSLSPHCGFDLVKNWTDYIGYEHHRMTQTFEKIPLEGAMFIIHSQNGIVRSSNGHLVKGRFPSSSNSIDEVEAWKTVRKAYKDYIFYQDIPGMEEWLKEQKNDPSASFLSEPKLVFLDPTYSGKAENYRLVWKFDIYTKKEIDHELVYVDAQFGEIFHVRSLTTSGCFNHDHQGCSHEATNISCEMVVPTAGAGYTYYNGIKEFIADSVGPSRFRLLDNTRGGGIRTLHTNNRTDTVFATEFIDDDNFWDLRNQGNSAAAIDAHWAATQTYDFWKNEYNYSSFDNVGTRMTSYVHWDVGWFNAVWNGTFARFGDGNGDPLTYIDITAHEFTHGLTGNSAGLIYSYESGALNESFSDIFGTAVEFEALGDTAPWTLGIPTSPFRDMSNPQARNHPDTYKGRFWAGGVGDNGGVHTNSGVQNYWFYLLSEGGSGVNDNGDAYLVDSLGMKKAAAIAFRNLTTYLVPSSNYYEARIGSLMSAIDLYGECSPEVIAVAQAWAAVGVGGPLDPMNIQPDIQLVSSDLVVGSCNTGDIQLQADIRLNISGCNQKISNAEVIGIGYQVDDSPPVVEILTLNNDVNEGDVFQYQFQQPPSFSDIKKHEVNIWVEYDGDSFLGNDTLYSQPYQIPITYHTSPASMVFVRPNTAPDSFYIEQNENSVAGVSFTGRNPIYRDRFGFEMTGARASLRNVDPGFSEREVFNNNHNFGAKICFCVDATSWKDVHVAFDRRQTFSSVYVFRYRRDVPELVSSMRLMLNGQQIGDLYHPTTYTEDPWERDTVPISQVAGSSFEFCFEGRHFIDRATDNTFGRGTSGDYTFLDKIIFFDPDAVSNKNVTLVDMNVQPNPGSDQVWITMDQSEMRLMESLQVTNQLGEVVLTQKISQNVDQRIGVNTENLVPGVYFIQLRGNKQLGVAKWVKE